MKLRNAEHKREIFEGQVTDWEMGTKVINEITKGMNPGGPF